MDILNLLKRPEGKTLEFKRDLSSPEGVLRTLVAFANTAGGTVLIGVEDRTKHVRGIPSPLDTEEKLANLISDRIVPRLVPDLEILAWRSTNLLAVRVYPSPLRPHFLAKKGGDNIAFVRVGSTNRRADAELIEELRRSIRRTGYDEEPMSELDTEAIDFRAASESFATIRKLKPSDLETLNLITRVQGRKVPTVAGILLFGHKRTHYFPDAWIQVGRFRGSTRSHIMDQRELRGYPVNAIGEAIEFVHKHSLVGAEIGALRRTDRWTIPPVALREAIVNAVVHADYAQSGAPIRLSIFGDRIEVESPGLLPFGLTVEDLHQGVSKLRNRVIGRVFHSLGLIEQWGSGIARMTEACQKAGLESPILEELGTHFRVTLPTLQVMTPKQDDRDQSILTALSVDEGKSTREISEAIGLSARATRTRLTRLIGQGLVVEVGTSPQDPMRRYFRSQ